MRQIYALVHFYVRISYTDTASNILSIIMAKSSILRYIDIITMKSSLEVAQCLHSAYLQRTIAPEIAFKYIKENIRNHLPDHLSAMIYYTGLLGHFEKEIWELYEMQISRTNIAKVMPFVSLVRTAEGFARKPGDYFEVFDAIEYHLLDKVSCETFNPSEACRCLYCFASLNRGTNEFWKKITDKVYNERNKLPLESSAKALWALSTMQIKGDLCQWLQNTVYTSRDLLSPALKRQTDWALLNININISK